jgi:hypothetical protein
VVTFQVPRIEVLGPTVIVADLVGIKHPRLADMGTIPVK